MALRFVTGDPAYYNVLARGVLTSSSADALFALVNVKDGDPAKPFKFATAGADLWLKIDTSMLVGSNMDFWSIGVPIGWTKSTSGSGTVTEDTVIKVTGSSAKFFNPGAGNLAKLAQDVTVRAGQRLSLVAKLRAELGAEGRIQIQNKATGKWLNSIGQWQSGSSIFASIMDNTGGVFVTQTVTFRVEDFLTVGAETCTLAIALDNNWVGLAGDELWYDDVYLYPGIEFVSVHGHNLNPVTSLLVQTSDDDSAYSTLATLTPRGPSFYGTWATTYKRYWRLPYVGTPPATVYYGEVVLGQLDTALRAHLYGWPTRYIFDQVRMETDTGNVQSFKQALLERRAVKLEFQLGAQAQFEQLRDEWARRSFGGLYPMIVVPDDSDASLVIQGRMLDEWEATKHFLTVWGTDVVIAESGFPTVVG